MRFHTLCKFILLIFREKWKKKSLKSRISGKKEDEFEKLRESILSHYSPTQILKQYNILKRLINKSCIPNKIKVRIQLIHSFRNTVIGLKVLTILNKLFHSKSFTDERDIPIRSIFRAYD